MRYWAHGQRNQEGMESRPVEVGRSLSSMRKIVSSETNWLKEGEQEDLCEGCAYCGSVETLA